MSFISVTLYVYVFILLYFTNCVCVVICLLLFLSFIYFLSPGYIQVLFLMNCKLEQYTFNLFLWSIIISFHCLQCQYELRLKKGSGINLHVQRTLPSTRSVHADNKDVRDLRLIILRPFNQMDVALKVDTDPQHLSSLVAQLYREDLPDSPIQTIKLGLHPYFMLPPMNADRRTYFVRLESNLPYSQYHYSTSEVTFVADSAFKHLNLSFKPTLRSVDAEMSQGTVVGFATAIILVMLAFNYDKMGSLMEKVSHITTTMTAPRMTQKSSSATSEMPSTETGRKRIKPRKVWLNKTKDFCCYKCRFLFDVFYMIFLECRVNSTSINCLPQIDFFWVFVHLLFVLLSYSVKCLRDKQRKVVNVYANAKLLM